MYTPATESVFLLDLCIFAYQLHAQSLIWPVDPYYERLGRARSQFMAQVHTKSGLFRAAHAAERRYRGPGPFIGEPAEGWLSNPRLDPIVADYRLINPWRTAFTSPEKPQWIVYDTSQKIIGRIGVVKMVQFEQQQGPYHDAPQVTVISIDPQQPALANPATATSLLYAFEGGTGSTHPSNDATMPAIWSLMGYALAEDTTDGEGYNVFIVFRGSRSGIVRMIDAKNRKGNADWVTDLNYVPVKNPPINQYTETSLGNGISVKRMLPTIWRALNEIHQTKGGPPENIYVTGHSLGGALAISFASAMLFGSSHGVFRQRDGAPPLAGAQDIDSWPWPKMKLSTFGSPVVETKLFADLFALFLPSQRIWLYGDPITIEGRFHPLGQELRIPQTAQWFIGPFQRHSPDYIRKNLLLYLEKLGLDTSGAPAAEPWQEFDSFEATKRYLQQSGYGKDLSASLLDFDVRLTLFIETLAELGQGSTALKNVARAIKKQDFNTLGQPNELLAFLKQQADALKADGGLNKDWKTLLSGLLLLVGIGKDLGILGQNYASLISDDF